MTKQYIKDLKKQFKNKKQRKAVSITKKESYNDQMNHYLDYEKSKPKSSSGKSLGKN